MESFKVFKVPETLMANPTKFLRTRQVADALGVGRSTIQRWVDDGEMSATRTPGGHRLVELAEAIRYAEQHSYPTAALRLFAGDEIEGPSPAQARPTPRPVDDEARESLFTALRAGRMAEARRVVIAAYDAGSGAVALGDDLIRPVMQRIGDGWMAGEVRVYHEHQATGAVVAALGELVARAASRTAPGLPLALGASPEGDPYTLPGLLGELTLRELGWDVRNLGVHLPLSALAEAAREYRPRLIFLSVSHLADEARFAREYRRFYEAASEAGAAVILGGRALGPDLRAGLVFASFGDRLAHLAEFARQLRATPGADGMRNATSRNN